jgi:hypothetical protein
MCQALIKSRSGFLATRALLGMLQGGFIPDLCLWMSYFYTSKVLPNKFVDFLYCQSSDGGDLLTGGIRNFGSGR